MFSLLPPAFVACCLQVGASIRWKHKWTNKPESWIECLAALIVLSLLALCISPLQAIWSIGYHGVIRSYLETEKEYRLEHQSITRGFDTKTAKQVARILPKPLQCRGCGFGPVEHYLCDDISDQCCPMCFARSNFFEDGYKETTDFSHIMIKAKIARERALQVMVITRNHEHIGPFGPCPHTCASGARAKTAQLPRENSAGSSGARMRWVWWADVQDRASPVGQASVRPPRALSVPRS